jgi:hypothetical protein
MKGNIKILLILQIIVLFLLHKFENSKIYVKNISIIPTPEIKRSNGK